MTLHEIEREALSLSPAERAVLAGLILRSLGQALEQLGGKTAVPDRSALEGHIESIFAEAFSGEAEKLTDEYWGRLLHDELPELEPTALDLLALPAASRA